MVHAAWCARRLSRKGDEREGTWFFRSLSVPPLFWEEGRFPTFPHTGWTSVRRCVRQEAGDGQRRWLCSVLQQCLRRPVSSPVLKVGTFLPELSYTWCEGRLFFSYPYISCDYPHASKAGTVFMEMQDKLV